MSTNRESYHRTTGATGGERIKHDPSNVKRLMENFVKNKTYGRLIPKKKMHQLKLKEAFKTRNFQKYNVKQCVYDPDLQTHVYEPPKYSKGFTEEERLYSRCCCDCYLRPCITIGKRDVLLETVTSVAEDPNLARRNGRTRAFHLFHELCGPLFMKRMKIKRSHEIEDGVEYPTADVPECVNSAIENILKNVSLVVEGKQN